MDWEAGGRKEENRSESDRLAMTGPEAWMGKGKQHSAAVKSEVLREQSACSVRSGALAL